MKFTKMHGCGNDYVYVNLFEEKIADPAKVSIAVSDRHFGIGSDGLITIGPSDIADFRMRIYNADGSEAEMCGNGIRCVAKYVYDHKMTDKKKITIETGAGGKNVAADGCGWQGFAGSCGYGRTNIKTGFNSCRCIGRTGGR